MVMEKGKKVDVNKYISATRIEALKKVSDSTQAWMKELDVETVDMLEAKSRDVLTSFIHDFSARGVISYSLRELSLLHEDEVHDLLQQSVNKYGFLDIDGNSVEACNALIAELAQVNPDKNYSYLEEEDES
jgi:hypothetical protein